MKMPFAICLLFVVALTPGCSGHGCRHTDWCACSNGTECVQSCEDNNGCRFFCDHMAKCGATCGTACNIEFHDAKENVVTCGDACNISCHDGPSCDATCGADCTYTSYNTDTSTLRAGPNSMIACVSVKNCVVECTGSCVVSCTDQVDQCQVTCPNGASPVTCTDGRLACGDSC